MLNYRRTLRNIFFLTQQVLKRFVNMYVKSLEEIYWLISDLWAFREIDRTRVKVWISNPGPIGLNLFSVNYQIRPSKLEIKSKLKTVDDKSNFGIVKTVMDEALL